MTRIVIDESTRRKLRDLREPLEVCDDSGRILAYLTPADDPSIYDELVSPTSEEELDRRSRAAGGRPLAEILTDLERRASRGN
jgi:IS4 transposase